MSELFSNDAGQKLLASLRQVVEKKRVYHRRKNRFIMFVCGGSLHEGETSLRKQFVAWAETNLPDCVSLMAEDALKDSFAQEGSAFVNLSKFETILAEVTDCILIFPESPGSFAEAGFFSNSKVRNKTLVINPFLFQTSESFLNLGPIDTINSFSFLKPTVLLNASDFTPIRSRLQDRVKRPEQRERLPYLKFSDFNFKQKLLVVFEMLRLLHLASLKTLRFVLKACFDTAPPHFRIDPPPQDIAGCTVHSQRSRVL